jgi:N,N-dimethylformamidase
MIDVIVTNAELCTPLENVEISIIHSNNNINLMCTTKKDGKWVINNINDIISISFYKKGYVKKIYKTNELPPVVRLLEDKLIGYQDKLWFRPIEKVVAYINSPQDYSAKLFRHGLEKKLILDLGMFKSQYQHVPDGYFVENGLNWNTSLEYTIPSDATDGIYSLMLESDICESFAIPFIVSHDNIKNTSKNKILVLASTNNWQTYNTWGGRSRYRNFESENSNDFIKTYALADRIKNKIGKLLPLKLKHNIKKVLKKPIASEPKWYLKKLSIKRPFTNCSLEDPTVIQPFTNHLAGGEWRLLAWLERENFSYDIISGFELHNNPNALDNYKTIIFNTHCEYWSKNMYNAIKKFHEEETGWILNISGNTMFREVDFFEDGSIRCVSTSFNRSCADETQLIGVRFTMDDYSTCSPYKVIDANNWVFNGLPIKKDMLFGGISLNQNTHRKTSRYDAGRPGTEFGLEGMGSSGWECDKLSETAPNDIKLIAKGINKHGGADMVIRESKGTRGGMFSASSLVFSGSLLVDYVASTIVKNVIRKATED